MDILELRAYAQARGGANYRPETGVTMAHALTAIDAANRSQAPVQPARGAWDDLPYVTGPVCYVCKSSIVTIEDRGGVCRQCRLDAQQGAIL